MNSGKNYLPLRDPSVMSLHSFKDFTNYTFPHPNGTLVRTCPAALGYSFAAGTTDGPGSFDFKQNDPDAPNANPVWAVVSGFLHEPSEEQRRCHGKKPILLDVGEVDRPYLWTPNIVDIQLLRVGPLIIIVSPGEATTMAGRRWREALANNINEKDLDGFKVVLGGPANSYTHYIATEEEYAIQRYEGASTLYGPHTLNAYIHVTRKYLGYLIMPWDEVPAGPDPPIHTNSSLSFIRGVVFDRAPFFKDFGDVVQDVEGTYRHGETVRTKFVGANPRNNLLLEATYAAVERQDDNTGIWKIVRDDEDWSLIFKWLRTNTVLGTSEVEISWEIEQATEEGIYRIRYFGHHKAPVSGEITPFEGVSGEFLVW